MSSYFQATSADRVVTIWPNPTDRAHYDVIVGDTSSDDIGYVPLTDVRGVTAMQAAAYVLTEIGVGVGVTLERVTRQIGEWRRNYEESGENVEGA